MLARSQHQKVKTISSQFIEVAGRRVFMRYAGSGPALLLLHQSPQSSRALLPWIERLADQYAVFAPDTPGFGYSDPLPLAEPEIPDFAAGLDKLLAALGVEKTLVYGVHTGAVTALRLALDFPHRVAGLLCDGYARFNREEREDLLASYLPPFEPAWDGGHLTSLFQRMREQNFFFPWHDYRKSARLAYPLPAVAAVHANVMDVLDAGDGYRAGYRAPFLYDDATAAARLKVSAQIFYRAEDVLAPHKDRLPGLPAHVKVDLVNDGPPELVARADAFFSTHGERSSLCDAAKSVGKAVSRTRSIAAKGIALRVVDGAGLGTHVEMGDIGHPAQMPVTRDMSARAIVIDLPGHGASRDWPAERCGVDDVASAIYDAVKPLLVGGCHIVSHGGCSAFAASLAVKLGLACKQLTLHSPIACDVAQRDAFLASLPALKPTAEGGYLLAAWNWARTNAMFSPWEKTRLFGNEVRKPLNVTAPAARRVHAQVVEMLRAGPCFAALWKSALDADLQAVLKDVKVPVEIVAAAETDAATSAGRLAGMMSWPMVEQVSGNCVWRKSP